ncbi:unnamed protein product [Penicillium roqueforti FM164]|uniref:Genomic scaffold, ProqFM164S02 n=1 Tax=Penicillium roqueforti (strain FM164) TaxID=1365484 RepID=W6Q2S7_PENRF|nr:unnamed protein product [Penicillium roqueforti FM164]
MSSGLDRTCQPVGVEFPTYLDRPNPQFDAQCHGISQLVSLEFRMEYEWIRILFLPPIIPGTGV